MVNAMFGGDDPAKVVPAKYRPAKAKPREPTPEQRAVAEEAGLMLLGGLLGRMTTPEG